MGDYKKVCRCKDCGKIYDKGIPYICSKCGAEIGKPTPTILQMMGCGEVTLTENARRLLLKKVCLDGRLENHRIPRLYRNDTKGDV